jgi:hypothetical protein
VHNIKHDQILILPANLDAAKTVAGFSIPDPKQRATEQFAQFS